MLRLIILYIVSSGIGTFVCKVFEQTPVNVWFARGFGCLTTVLIALLLYKLWLKKAIIAEESKM